MLRLLACLVPLLPPTFQDPPQPTEHDACRIHGQLVDEAGAPVSGVQIRVKGWGANSSRKKRFGTPKNWVDPGPFESDADGRFDFGFVPPQAFQFTIACTHADWANLGWRWSQIELGEVRNLGVVRLERPGVIAGHIVDGQGELLSEGWRVMASMRGQADHHRGISTKHTGVDPDTGTFRFTDLPPGQVQLTATSLAGERLKPVMVTSSAEEESWIELVHKGATARDSIFVQTSSAPFIFAPTEIEPGAIQAIDASGKSWPFKPFPNRPWEWSVSGLTPGPYAIRVESPLFLPWSREDVNVGAKVIVNLTGRGELALQVLDAQGQPLPAYAMSLRPKGHSHAPDLQTLTQPLPIDGLYSSIVPGEYELAIEAPGYTPHVQNEVRILDAVPLELSIRMRPTTTVGGRVLYADDSPAAGLVVQATPGSQAGHNGPMTGSMSRTDWVNGKQVTSELPYRQEEVSTDAEGRFQLTGLGTGLHTLRVIVSPWARVDQTCELGSDSDELVLILPALGAIEGQIVFDEERPEGDLHVDQPLFVDGMTLGQLRGNPFPGAPVDEEGRFQLGPLLAGDQELSLMATKSTASGSSRGSQQTFRVPVTAGPPTQYTLSLVKEPGPHSAELRITLGGQPIEQAIGLYIRHSEEWDSQGRQRLPRMELAEGGLCTVEGLEPGNYTVAARSNDSWNWQFPEPLTLGPNSASSITLDVPRVERTIRIQDPQGKPRAATPIWHGINPFNFPAAPLTTDDQGTLTLTLVPGRYYFSLQQTVDRRAERLPYVTWEAGQEPLQLILP